MIFRSIYNSIRRTLEFKNSPPITTIWYFASTGFYFTNFSTVIKKLCWVGACFNKYDCKIVMARPHQITPVCILTLLARFVREAQSIDGSGIFSTADFLRVSSHRRAHSAFDFSII
ncbi:MAG: hypothetical protein CMM52_10580 [Rhodospirillaceae bacterium]|nr:hypothetical protein [Rhodospirillaceae bacterium]